MDSVESVLHHPMFIRGIRCTTRQFTVYIYDLEDFRLVGHMLHAARNGCSRTIVRGNDTDICIILLAYLPTLLQCNSAYKLLFDCGTGASRFMFIINHIGDCIGLERCRGLLFVYSLSGCDFTPSFFDVSKIKFFDLDISYTYNV